MINMTLAQQILGCTYSVTLDVIEDSHMPVRPTALTAAAGEGNANYFAAPGRAVRKLRKGARSWMG